MLTTASDQNGNPISMEQIASIVRQHRIYINTKYAREPQTSKKRQMAQGESDEEERVADPSTPKRRRHTESSDEIKILEEEEVESEAEEGEGEGETDSRKVRWNANNDNMKSVEKRVLYKTNLETFQELCGYNTAYDAEPQRIDKYGHPIY
ncbi:hypothetical protein RhiJN_06531 [Ceratobasidium sp. AG-Ba]|nr:hypothetical protein RhiJN_06531 [Ceratobasidium sp. AG-Ba]